MDHEQLFNSLLQGIADGTTQMEPIDDDDTMPGDCWLPEFTDGTAAPCTAAVYNPGTKTGWFCTATAAWEFDAAARSLTRLA